MTAKIILSVLIIAFTSFCGYLLTKKYRKKKLFYLQFYEFNERFLNEIAYYRRPLAEFVEKYPYKGEFKSLLLDFFNRIKRAEATLGFVYANDEIDFLTKQEKAETDDYFHMLGKGDSASQKAFFSTEKERLKGRLQGAELQYKRYGDLYVKLGFLCGLFIIILII